MHVAALGAHTNACEANNPIKGSTVTGHSFLVDSGCKKHCSGQLDLFHNLRKPTRRMMIKTATGELTQVAGVGDVNIRLWNQQKQEWREITLKNVLYVPTLAFNLISVRQLWKDNRLKTSFAEKGCFKDVNTNERFTFSTNGDGMYAQHANVAAIATTARIPYRVLHARLGHIGHNRLRLAQRLCTGLPETIGEPEPCSSCLQGGSKNKSFNKSFNKQHTRRTKVKQTSTQMFTKFGERVDSDVCSGFPESAGHKYKYAINFFDHATRTVDVMYMRTKSSADVQRCLERFEKKNKQYLAWNDGHVRQWHTDNGGEFTSECLNDFCEELSVRRTYSTPWTPQQNPYAERDWGVMLRTMRITMVQSKVPENFWTYCMSNAAHLHDVLPCSSLPGGISPYEARTGKKPNLSKIRTWGCECFYMLPVRDRPTKLHPVAVSAVHLGRDPRRDGWLIYIPSLNRVTTAYHLGFGDEEHFINPDAPSSSAYGHSGHAAHGYDEDRDVPSGIPGIDASTADKGERATHDPNYQHVEEDHFVEDHCSDSKCTFGRHAEGTPHSWETIDDSKLQGPPSARTRSHFNEHVVSFVDDCNWDTIGLVLDNQMCCGIDDTSDFFTDQKSYGLFSIEEGTLPTPTSYAEALASRFAAKWRESMEKEVRDLIANDTWSWVKRDSIAKGRRAAKSKWVYKIKYARDGTIERFKSRFVVCGYSQREGLDYSMAFSATMRSASFRTLLALCVQAGLKIEHLDVTQAFTQAPFDNEMWVEPPKGFEQCDAEGNEMVLLLKKALYGTKQASRLWQQTLFKWLEAEGFKQCRSDPCLFVRRNEGGVMIIGIYVDDILAAHSNDKAFKLFSDRFCSPKTGFKAKHLGKLEWFLGIAVDQLQDGSISVNQTKYIIDMLDKFIPGWEDSSIMRNTPYSVTQLEKVGFASSDEERERMRRLPYLEIVGSLLYCHVQTRPDCLYTSSLLAKYMSDPSLAGFEAAKQCLLYLGKTRDLKITFSKEISVSTDLTSVKQSIMSNYGFVAYSDASWGVKNPCFGYSIFMSNGPVSFAAKSLKSAESSAEAEYAAAYEATKDIKFIRNLCDDLGYTLTGDLILAVDNKAAIDIANNVGVTARNKHFDRVFHLIREEVQHLRLRLIHVSTDRQRADLHTKALSDFKFIECRKTHLR